MNKWKKRMTSMLTVAVMATSGIAVSSVTAEASPLRNVDLGVKLVQNGGIIYDANHPHFGVKSTASGAKAKANLPAKYDLREQKQVTDIRFQNPWGTCWAFGTLASIESSVLKQGGSLPDYSEKALAWYTNSQQAGKEDSESAKEGQSMIPLDKSLQDSIFDSGANILSIVSQLSTGNGAALEKDVPYKGKGNEPDESKNLPNGTTVYYPSSKNDWTLDDSHLYDNAYRLEGTKFVAASKDGNSLDQSTMNSVKTMLMDSGAVVISYCSEESTPDDLEDAKHVYFNEETNAQYCSDDLPLNHMVAIVGWDDHFSKDRFSETPPGDGAWIVKNSWSDKWGDNGYFYLSYYDQTIAYYVGHTADMPNEAGMYGYDHRYQYDYAGARFFGSLIMESVLSEAIQKAAPNQEVKVANIFQAKGEETLTEVGLSDYLGGTLDVTTEIYRLSDNKSPVSGKPVTVQKDKTEGMYYQTIYLNEPVDLKKGEYFSVVQTIQLPDGTYRIPVELGNSELVPVKDTEGNVMMQMQYTASSAPGQSFIYGCQVLDDGENSYPEWMDLGSEAGKEFYRMPVAEDAPSSYGIPGNVMIKAFTADTNTVLNLSNMQTYLNCYDKQGSRMKRIALSGRMDKITLPRDTASISFDVEGKRSDSVTVTLNGKSYKAGTSIPRSTIEASKTFDLTLTGLNRGVKGSRTYSMELTIDTPSATLPAAPRLKASANYNSVKLSWNKVKEAKGYQVYRATKKNGKYKKVKTTTARSWRNKKLTTGKTYYYKVRAYKKTDGKILYGKFSKKVKATARPARPALKLKTSKGKVTAKWSKVSGATHYQIYRASKKSGKYHKYGQTAKQSWTDQKIKQGKTYYYKVRACRTVKGKTVYGTFTKARKAKIK